MRTQFEISIAGRTPVPVGLEKEKVEGAIRYHVEIPSLNVKLDFKLLRESENEFVLSSDGKNISRVILVKSGPKSAGFIINGRQILAERKRKESSHLSSETVYTGVAQVSENVVSNFPAKVIKVNARSGDRMNEGETLIVVEAMKMEAQIKVPSTCVVSEMLVSEGDRIEKGRLLARLKFTS